MSLFSKNSTVIELTPKDFQGKNVKHYLLDGKTRGMVMFGAKWCHYCKLASPEYIKSSIAFGSAFPLFYVDCEKHGEFASKNFGVKGYPMFMYINKEGKPYKKYEEDRTFKAFTNAVCTESGVCKK